MTPQSSVASNMSTLANAGSQSSLLSNMTTDSFILTNNMSNLQINNVTNQQSSAPSNTPQPSPLPNPFLQATLANNQPPTLNPPAFPNNQYPPLPSLFGNNAPPTAPVLHQTPIYNLPSEQQYQPIISPVNNVPQQEVDQNR